MYKRQVDDEQVLVKGIKFNLEHEGYQVEVGYDGEQAVELAREGSFDLILLDLMMPKIDGLQACMRIREFSNAVSYTHLIAVAAMMEHIGDMSAISATVGENFIENPGLHRTLIGDGIATSLAGMFGGPANTTYGENTGVLELSQVFDPKVVRLAAVYAVVLSLSLIHISLRHPGAAPGNRQTVPHPLPPLR